MGCRSLMPFKGAGFEVSVTSLRRFASALATALLIFFLTFWCALALALFSALFHDGLSGIRRSLIHIAGGNGLFRDSSDMLAAIRLSILALLTVATFYLRQRLRKRNRTYVQND